MSEHKKHYVKVNSPTAGVDLNEWGARNRTQQAAAGRDAGAGAGAALSFLCSGPWIHILRKYTFTQRGTMGGDGVQEIRVTTLYKKHVKVAFNHKRVAQVESLDRNRDERVPAGNVDEPSITREQKDFHTIRTVWMKPWFRSPLEEDGRHTS